MTVAEYEAKFTELSRFVPEFVNTDLKRSRRFQQRLKQWIQNRVSVLELTDYASLVQKATIVESGAKTFRGTRSQPIKSLGFRRTENRSLGQGGKQTGVSHFSQPRPPLPDCKTCGRKNARICALGTVNCYKCNRPGHFSNAFPQNNMTCIQCGRTGHLRKDCKSAKPAASGMSRAASNKPPTAKTFNMTVRDAVRDTDVIAAEPLKEVLRVEIANRKVIPVSQVHPDYNLEIEGQQFHVDLVPFKLGEFDVILGMDWLSSNGAQIDCERKKIKLKVPGGQEVLFKGQR
ncbi:hypothetical protein POM88_001088 [Heracleum sosnowskyi]|uniref:CCHC-type domain-containing protein n=1 Tax=Heracleum sosnowskyi TaxID=360622 RepID=A0AAD8JCV6_9APIA|nr:hypothetical protein POM88_001088 [Heracleum sosnowskyi]